MFGLGLNTVDKFTVASIEFLHPHSMYLATTDQDGLAGLALFSVIIAATISTLVKNYEAEDAKLEFCIPEVTLPAYLLDGHELVDKVGPTWFLFWLPVGISLEFAWRRRLR